MVQSAKRGKIFFGWWMVLAFFLILFNTTGVGFYSFPVFIGPLQAEFGWSMTQISVGVSIFVIVMTFSTPVVGVLIGRYGIPRVMVTTALLVSIGNLGYAQMQSLWMLYALMGLSGFAIVGVTILPAQTAIINWFNKYRGRALALAFVGPGAGGFLMPPFNEFLIRWWSWRFAWVFAAIGLWVLIIPLVAIFVRTKPSDKGLLPDGEMAGSESLEGFTGAMSGLPVRHAVRSQTFWLVLVIFLLQFTGLSALNLHFVPFAEQQAGFATQQAAFYYGLAVGFSILGRLLAGWLVDRVQPQHVLVVTGLLMAAGPAALEIFIVRLGLDDPLLLVLYAAPYGIGYGANVIVIPVLVGRCFGVVNFARINGIIFGGAGFGAVIGIPLAGYIFDTTNSYEIVILACVIGCALSAGLALLIRPDRYRAQFVTEELGGGPAHSKP